MIAVKKKIYYWLGLSLGLSLILIFLGIVPYANKIDGLKNQIQDNRQKIAEMEERRQVLIESGRNYESLKNSDTAEVLGVLISREEVLGFINTLESAAEQEGIIQRIDINEESMDNGDELLINLFLEGEFSQLANYLDLLERQNFYLDPVSVTLKKTISQAPSESVTEKTTAQLKLKAYWQE